MDIKWYSLLILTWQKTPCILTFFCKFCYHIRLGKITAGIFSPISFKELSEMKIKGNTGLIFMYVAVALVIISLVHVRATDTASADFFQEVKAGVFTAYTADGAQTDSSPTITASNQKVQEGIVANNCLPFGTKIKLNGKIYEVQDRMHGRYGCDNFDIYMHDYSKAINFGIQPLKYEII